MIMSAILGNKDSEGWPSIEGGKELPDNTLQKQISTDTDQSVYKGKRQSFCFKKNIISNENARLIEIFN